jgi:hypothetical protein
VFTQYEGGGGADSAPDAIRPRSGETPAARATASASFAAERRAEPRRARSGLASPGAGWAETFRSIESPVMCVPKQDRTGASNRTSQTCPPPSY